MKHFGFMQKFTNYVKKNPIKLATIFTLIAILLSLITFSGWIAIATKIALSSLALYAISQSKNAEGMKVLLFILVTTLAILNIFNIVVFFIQIFAISKMIEFLSNRKLRIAATVLGVIIVIPLILLFSLLSFLMSDFGSTESMWVCKEGPKTIVGEYLDDGALGYSVRVRQFMPIIDWGELLKIEIPLGRHPLKKDGSADIYYKNSGYDNCTELDYPQRNAP